MPHFVLGPPPPNALVEGTRWARLPGYGPEPKYWLAALSVGVGTCLLVVLGWKLLASTSLPFGSARFAEVLAVALAIIIGHELVHLAVFPGAGRRDAIMGIWPQKFAAFVQYLRPTSRNRFVAVALAPFVVISLLPIALAASGLQVPPFIQWMSVINGFGAGGDLLASYLLLRHVHGSRLVLESNHGLYSITASDWHAVRHLESEKGMT